MKVEPETLSAPQQNEHADAESEHEEHGVIERADILRIALVVATAVFVWIVPRWGWVGIAGVLIGGFPIFAEAYENLRERRMTMELSMTLALVAALVIREFFTALIITLFVLVAEILEGLTVSRGRQAIADLLQFLPSTALLLLNGEFVECPIAAVRSGDRVLIRPGSRIPVDGKVVAGLSNVEEAAITGEPMPQEKLPGALVYAGTLPARSAASTGTTQTKIAANRQATSRIGSQENPFASRCSSGVSQTERSAMATSAVSRTRLWTEDAFRRR